MVHRFDKRRESWEDFGNFDTGQAGVGKQEFDRGRTFENLLALAVVLRKIGVIDPGKD